MQARHDCSKCATPRPPGTPCGVCARARHIASALRQKVAGIKRARVRKSRALPLELRSRGTLESRVRAIETRRRVKRAYKLRNPHKAVADCAARLAAKQRALPAWADRGHIDCLYAIARAYNDIGFAVHVDHIVPLRAKLVSGLHVEANLRIVPALVNMLKGNRHWPDMP